MKSMTIDTPQGPMLLLPSHMVLLPAATPDGVVAEVEKEYSRGVAPDSAENRHLPEDWEHVPFSPFKVERIGICTSMRCALRCRYCLECSAENQGTELDNKTILTYVNDGFEKWIVRNMLVGDAKPLQIYFTGGGEPVYDFQSFQELVSAIKDKSRQCSVPTELRITTNAVYGRECMEFICDHFSSIMISYDGLPGIQNKNRPSPHFPETSSVVESNIAYALSRNVSVTIRTTILPQDVVRLKEMADFLYGKFGSNFAWSIFPVKEEGRAKGAGFDTRQEYANIDFCDAYIEVCDYVRGRYGNVNVTSPILAPKKVDLYCGSLAAISDITWLRADARIATCLEMGAEETVVGHVVGSEVEYKATVRDHLTRIALERRQLCRECPAFPFCGGGCPAEHRTNAINGVKGLSWSCRQKIKFWQYVIGTAVSGRVCFGWRTQPSRCQRFEKYNVVELREEDSHDHAR